MQFTDEHKKEYKRGLPFGVTKVQIIQIQADEVNGKEFVEVFFVTPDGIEDSVRVWFTSDKAVQFSFNTLRDIYIHNAPEDKKDAARDTLNKATDTKSLVEILKKNLLGKEMWVTKYFDKSRTHEYNGQTYKDVNKNMYGYEPTLQPDLMPKKQDDDTPNPNLVQDAEEVFGTTATPDITDSWD